jgi:hypothetical protein
LFLSDSAGKNISKSPSLSVATLVEFAIFQREFMDYASRGGTRGLLECIAEDVKVNIKFYAAHKFEHLLTLKTIEVDSIPEKDFLELCLLRFSAASESDKTDIKKHLKAIKMSFEKTHLFNYGLYQKFVSAFLYGISIFRKFLPECNDKYFSKLFSDGVSLPIQKFAREHSDQVGPSFTLDEFISTLCEQAETLRVAEPTIEWTHGNAFKMGAAGMWIGFVSGLTFSSVFLNYRFFKLLKNKNKSKKNKGKDKGKDKSKTKDKKSKTVKRKYTRKSRISK